MAMMKVMILMMLTAGATQPAQGASGVPKLPREGPVTKVVNLLRRMQDQLLEEKKTDEEVYEKLSCWCSTNKKERDGSIEEAKASVDRLTAAIEELAAKAGGLRAELKQLKKETKKNEEALATATSMREKAASEFGAEEKELVQAISQLAGAISALSKQNGGASEEALVGVKQLMQRNSNMEGARAVLDMIQQPADYQSYNGRSGEIFGILGSMKDTFASNLSQAQKDEQREIAAFEELKAAKENEIESAKGRIVEKTKLLASTDAAHAQAKADLKDTRASLSADQKFLLDLDERCSASDKEWEERTQARSEELKGVGEAISILTDDNARDLFSGTLSFLEREDVKARAASVLRAAAAKSGNAQLSLLASSVTLDAFVKVKSAIDEMIVELKKQQKDEAAHRDWCTDELRKNDKQTWTKNNEKEDLTTKIATLADQISSLTSDIEQLEAEAAEMKVQLKHASEDREAENKEFQQTVADQRATATILGKALQRLREVYEPAAVKAERAAAPNGAEQKRALLQQAPPKGFKKYSKNENSGGVLGLLRMTIDDAQRMVEDALQAEQESQKAYEGIVKDTSDGLAMRQRTTTDKRGAKAEKEVQKVSADADLEATMTDLDKLAQYASEVHTACDYVTKNFDLRQESRQSEIDALEDAKAILSGSNFS